MNCIEGCKTKYELALLAKLAQQAERFDEMVMYADKLLTIEEELSSSERNLCASAYKSVVSNRRAELKVLEAASKKLSHKDSQSGDAEITIENYRQTIEN